MPKLTQQKQAPVSPLRPTPLPSGALAVLVVVPTYNEAANLPAIVRRLRCAVPTAAMLVVDDGSPDGTGALADRMAAADPAMHVLHRGAKGGLGAAYVAGFTWALEHGYDVVVEMDADGSQSWPRRRELLSRWGNRYVRAALGIPLQDATGGYRAFRAEVLRALPLAEIASQGYCFQVELAWRSVRAGFRVREVPITFTERAAVESKMSGSIVREALWRVTKWGLGRLHGSPDRP